MKDPLMGPSASGRSAGRPHRGARGASGGSSRWSSSGLPGAHAAAQWWRAATQLRLPHRVQQQLQPRAAAVVTLIIALAFTLALISARGGGSAKQLAPSLHALPPRRGYLRPLGALLTHLERQPQACVSGFIDLLAAAHPVTVAEARYIYASALQRLGCGRRKGGGRC
jgi:hypothetical protein